MGQWVRVAQTLIFGIGYLNIGLSLGAIGPTIQPLASQLGVDISDMGWMFASRGVGALFGSLLLGKMYDLGAPSVTFAACLMMLALSMYIVALLPSFLVAVAAHFLMGVGLGCADTGGNTLVGWLWNGSPMLGAAMQLLHACFGVGASLVAIAAANLSMENTYYLMGLLVGLAAALVMSTCGIQIDPPQASNSNSNSSSSSNNNTNSKPNKSIHSDSRTTELLAVDNCTDQVHIEVQASSDVGHAAASPRDSEMMVVMYLSLMMLMLVGVEAAFGGLIGVYATRMLGMSESDSAYVTFSYWSSFTVARVASILIVMLIPQSVFFTIDTIGCVLSLLVLLVFPYHSWAVWFSSIGFGVSLASTIPLCISLAPLLGYTLSGSSTRYLMFGASIGGLAIPFVLAQLIDYVAPLCLPIVSLLVMLCTYAIFLVLWLRNRSAANVQCEALVAVRSSDGSDVLASGDIAIEMQSFDIEESNDNSDDNDDNDVVMADRFA
jgi:fucose permease